MNPPPTGRTRLVASNAGLGLVWCSLLLPWAEVAGRVRTGPAFADLLLDLPDIALLGDHLRLVAIVWYAIPLLALATWLTQFRSWPPSLGRLTTAAAVPLGLSVAASVLWLAARGVGFPQPGPVVATLGAAAVVAACIRRPSSGEPDSCATDRYSPATRKE